MGTSQVRFLFLGCEHLDEDSTLTGAWTTPSQLTGDGQVYAAVSPSPLPDGSLFFGTFAVL